MIIAKLEDYINGWIVGDFTPTMFKNPHVEVGIHHIPAGANTVKHFHKVAQEINVVVSGKVEINGHAFGPNDIFAIEQHEISSSIIYEDTVLVVIKYPSTPGDKYEV